MSAGEAARRRSAVSQGTVEALPGGERSVTFVGLVPVVEEESGHRWIVARKGCRFIGGDP
jgi:hypothetical protein